VYPIDFFWRSVARFPDRPAIASPEGELSYAALGASVARRARGLLAHDPRPGTFVGVGGANSPDHLVTLLAVLAAGKIWVPLNPRNGDAELCRILDFIRPEAVFTDNALAARLGGAGSGVLAFDTFDAFDAAEPGTVPPPPPSVLRALDEPQAVKFTGGSTGTPKGVQQPMRAWNANIVTQIYHYGLGPDDRYLVSAPITHGTSTYVLPILGTGGVLVFPDGSKAEALLEAMAAHAVTITFAPPILIHALAVAHEHAPCHLPALRYLVYGGAPMAPTQILKAQACFGPVLCTSFGQTEAPQIATFMPPRELTGSRLQSAGRPSILTEVAILDDEGNPQPTGTEGEIAIRGDLVMTGYLRMPEQSAEVLVGGWLRTGDIGQFDPDGYLFIRGRRREVIITGGFNVYPIDVEAVIARWPGVEDCAVIGLPDDKWGEAVHAAVQPCGGGAIDVPALLAHVREALGPVKTPKAVHLFETLPRSPVGKVQKIAIRETIAAQARPAEPADAR
jgi:acyl-CoA synthetase (AMP-forming)/AMP-acid ligase II